MSTEGRERTRLRDVSARRTAPPLTGTPVRAIELKPDQVEFLGPQISTKVQEEMEEATKKELGVEELLDAWDSMLFYVTVLKELHFSHRVRDVSLVREVATDALSDYRDSVGYEAIVQRRIESGEMAQWKVEDNESPQEAILRQQEEIDEDLRRAVVAALVLDAVGHHELSLKAEAGDPQAKVRLAARRRWAEEDAKLRSDPPR